eukprot:scaffold87865_cov19-Prasinocladus_malaysianus.AAC.1
MKLPSIMRLQIREESIKDRNKSKPIIRLHSDRGKPCKLLPRPLRHSAVLSIDLRLRLMNSNVEFRPCKYLPPMFFAGRETA